MFLHRFLTVFFEFPTCFLQVFLLFSVLFPFAACFLQCCLSPTCSRHPFPEFVFVAVFWLVFSMFFHCFLTVFFAFPTCFLPVFFQFSTLFPLAACFLQCCLSPTCSRHPFPEFVFVAVFWLVFSMFFHCFLTVFFAFPTCFLPVFFHFSTLFPLAACFLQCCFSATCSRHL